MKEHRIETGPLLRQKLFETNSISLSKGYKFAQFKLFRGQKDISWKLQSKIERYTDYKAMASTNVKRTK